jgi:hypothetical protein
MEPENLSIKLFAKSDAGLENKDFIQTFHRWIQEGRLDELMIDVADYGHVHHGPGVMLICHDAHYATDRGEGRLGLLYSRKRIKAGSVRERIDTALSKALRAARFLEEEPALGGRITFRTDELRFSIEDRLHAPNTPATLEAIRDDLGNGLERLYGTDPKLTHRARPKECFAVDIHTDGAVDLATLVSRLA